MRFRRPRARIDRFVRRARAKAGGAVRLGPGTIYILPTVQGLMFGILVAALLVAAVNYSNNLVFGLTFLLAGIGIAAMIQTWRNLSGLEIRIGSGEPVFAGETARFPVQLDNRRGDDRFALRLAIDRGAFTDADRVPAMNSLYAHGERQSHRRGWLVPQRLDLETRFPTGLFRAWSVIEPSARALVYPAPLEGVPRPPTATQQNSGVDGPASEEGDEDFAGLRPYRPGEPLHRVSWKAAARTGDLHSKLFSGESRIAPRIDWNDAVAPDEETRLRILSAWVVEASENQAAFSFHLPGLDTGIGQGEAHRESCLHALALFGAKG